MPTTNFLPWDQPQTNMKTDAAYSSDPQRTNGGAVGAAFPSSTFNKFGLQSSGMAYALAQFLVSKGFTINDSNLPAIVSALQTLFANVPGRADLLLLTYAPTLVCDASVSNGWEIPLAGNVTLSVTNRAKGQELTFQFIQQSGGNHTVTWPSDFFGALQPDPTNAYATVMTFKIGNDLTGRAATPPMSIHGISAPIGETNQLYGGFSSAVVNTSLATQTLSVSGNSVLASATVNASLATQSLSVSGTATVAALIANISAQVPTVASTDSSTNAATTAWAKFGFALSLGINGYFKFPTWLGGLILQWGRATSGTSSVTVNYPLTPFPNNVFVVLPISAPAIRDSVYLTAFSNSDFSVGTAGSTLSIHWVAIGN